MIKVIDACLIHFLFFPKFTVLNKSIKIWPLLTIPISAKKRLNNSSSWGVSWNICFTKGVLEYNFYTGCPRVHILLMKCVQEYASYKRCIGKYFLKKGVLEYNSYKGCLRICYLYKGCSGISSCKGVPEKTTYERCPRTYFLNKGCLRKYFLWGVSQNILLI